MSEAIETPGQTTQPGRPSWEMLATPPRLFSYINGGVGKPRAEM